MKKYIFVAIAILSVAAFLFIGRFSSVSKSEKVTKLRLEGVKGVYAAVHELEADLKNNPNDIEALVLLGWIEAFDLGLRDKALEHLRLAVIKLHEAGEKPILKNSNYWKAKALSGIGGIYLELNNYELGESFILKSVDALPTDAFFFLGVSALNFRKDYNFCIDFHKQAHQMNPNNQSLLIEQAVCFYLKGDSATASELVSTIDKEDIRNAGSLAQYHAVLKNYEEALKYLNRLLNRYEGIPLRQKQLLELIKVRLAFQDLINADIFKVWEQKIAIGKK